MLDDIRHAVMQYDMKATAEGLVNAIAEVLYAVK
jgi:hypothetical protein